MLKDKYYSDHYPKIDRVIFEDHWNGKIQELKNSCFRDLDKCKWNDPESFDCHFAIMTEYLGSTVYWSERYGMNLLEFDGYDLETITSIGISENSYNDQEPYFFNKDKSRWFSLDYVLDHLIKKKSTIKKPLKPKQLSFDFNQDQYNFDFNQEEPLLVELK